MIYDFLDDAKKNKSIHRLEECGLYKKKKKTLQENSERNTRAECTKSAGL